MRPAGGVSERGVCHTVELHCDATQARVAEARTAVAQAVGPVTLQDEGKPRAAVVLALRDAEGKARGEPLAQVERGVEPDRAGLVKRGLLAGKGAGLHGRVSLTRQGWR